MAILMEITDASVSYGSIKALRQANLTVQAGSVSCLIGANGAGKSTLLKAIVGLEPLVSGSINFDGQIIASCKAGQSLPTNKLVERGIALVPEGRRVFADMTVEENLDMGAFMVRDHALVQEKKREMYDLFPILGKRCRQKASQLSGGEQQMLAIGRALMSSPRMLLLDEPGLGLAPLVIKHIFAIIKRVNREDGVTVFLVEQNAKSALQASDAAYVVETGQIVLSGTGQELLVHPRVQEAYLGT